jgi:hypothetical protein
MIGLIDKASRDLVAIVNSTDGYDLSLYDTVEVTGDPREVRWNKATEQLVPRPPSPAEETDGALAADPRWQALRGASPAQIDAWLTNNVTNLAQARQVLKFLLLAVQKLAATRSPNST